MNLTVRTATSFYNNFSAVVSGLDTGILAVFNRILLAPLKLHLQVSQINMNSRFYAAICNYPAPHPVTPLELFHPGATIPIHHPAQSSGAPGLDCRICFIVTTLTVSNSIAIQSRDESLSILYRQVYRRGLKQE